MKSKLKFVLITAFIICIFTILFLGVKKTADPGKYMHISFDDVILVFEDLTNNAENYDSIFDNNMLNFLKSMHDKYGAVFSCYCFYENNDFNLSLCTDKFAEEFSENSDWLKFGFHNLNADGNLADADGITAENNYQKVITELLRITGGPESIDTVIRLQNFAGSRDAIDAILSLQDNPIKGLLTADDDRISYYLSASDNSYIISHDDFMDSSNNLLFISTDLRLENTWNPYYALKSISKDDQQNKVIEVFTHEWAMGIRIKAKIYTTCIFASKYGYTWDFPMNRY